MLGLSGIRLAGVIGGILAILASIGWVVRINDLRAEWHGKYDDVRGLGAGEPDLVSLVVSE